MQVLILVIIFEMKNEADLIIGETTQCIVCLKDAEFITGHVLNKGNHILAGWCKEHRESTLTDFDTNTKILYLANRTGCYGGWIKEYGIKKYIKS
jgi:hypothetical protein